MRPTGRRGPLRPGGVRPGAPRGRPTRGGDPRQRERSPRTARGPLRGRQASAGESRWLGGHGPREQGPALLRARVTQAGRRAGGPSWAGPDGAADAPLLEVAHGFFFQAEDGIRDLTVTGVQTCALPI